MQVRFHYFGNGDDWYAQVDDISLTCAAPVISVEPAALAHAQLPGTATTLPMTITNNGDSDLIWYLMEDDCDYPTNIPWLSISPDNGVILPAGDTSIDVTYDSTGLIVDTYTTNLCVASNDPITPTFAVPVEMTVDSADIIIAMKPFPDEKLEPGGEVEYTITVTNTSMEDQTIISLTDSKFDLEVHCPDSVGTQLTPSDSYTCTFKESLSGNAGEEHLNSATVKVNNNASESDSVSVNTRVAILNVNPAILVTREASRSYAQTGDTVEFTITVTNNSVDTDPVTFNSIIDDIYGDVTLVHDDITATDCGLGLPTQPGDSYTCSYSALIPDLHVEFLTTTVSVTGTDDEGNEAFASEKTTLILDYFSTYLTLVSR